MRKQHKDKLWTFRVSEQVKARLNRASEILDRPAAQIARDAILQKLDELAREYPQIDTPELHPSETQSAI